MAKPEFSAEERAAMKERAKELREEEKRKGKADAGEKDLLAKVAEMPEPDRSIATRIHELVKENAPELLPKTWYGQPAWAKDDKVVCFFQSAAKFNTRYATFGFQDAANLDEGSMWATSFAITSLTKADEATLAKLIKQAAS